MRQKLCVTLAVAVLALSGARETCKQFNEIKSLAGEWSGVWSTMLVYANAYAEGVESRPAQTLAASGTSSSRDETAVVVARGRRARARVNQTPRAKRDGATESRADLAAVLAAKPKAKTAAAVKVSKSRLRVAVSPAEIARAFHSDFDAEVVRTLMAGKEIELPRASMWDELRKHERAGVGRKAARAERRGAGGRGQSRFMLRLPELPRVSAEALRAGAAAAETWPAADAGGGPEGLGENEVFFVAPQPSSGLLNCDTQPRR